MEGQDFECKGRRRVKTSSFKIFLGKSRGGGRSNIKIVLDSSRGQDSKYSRESNMVSLFLLCDLLCVIIIQLAWQLDDAVHPAITPYSD